MSHQNNGACLSCAQIFNRYPNFNQELRDWFSAIQRHYPEAHISCAGRGMIDQNLLFQRGATKASWGHSAHNFNLAIDIFQLKDGEYNLDLIWFECVVGQALYSGLTWFGRPGAPFPERPHVEIANWPDLVHAGNAHLVK